MKYKVTKLDKRHTGYGIFKYYITPIADLYGHIAQYGRSSKEHMLLFELRNWMWENYGPGCERDHVGLNNDKILWAWDTEFNHKRLYLKTDEQLTFFTLKWLQVDK